MIWNAHFKTVNFLPQDKLIPFLNVDAFRKEVFKEFGPQNPYSVVSMLKQSWHRTSSRLGMVYNSSQDYLADPKDRNYRLPFAEIEEAERALQCKPLEMNLPKGRVLKFAHDNIRNPRLPDQNITRKKAYDSSVPIRSSHGARIAPFSKEQTGNGSVEVAVKRKPGEYRETHIPWLY
jgi:hypothetical protein